MLIDYDRFAHERLRVVNDGGSRGYDQGIRVYICPLCHDRKGRGWIGVTNGVVGCYNAGCIADPRLHGGAAELLRMLDGLADASEARRALRARYGTEVLIVAAPKPFDGSDFVRIPEGCRPFTPGGGWMQRQFELFATAQWNLGIRHLCDWEMQWSMTGELGQRILIPIAMAGRVVGWQARTIVDGVEPKYVTSRHGKQDDPKAQCGRPAAAMLFNIDAVGHGDEILVVEGGADAIGWHRDDRSRSPVATAILGVNLTSEKAALIASKDPERVVVALDEEPEAQARGQQHAKTLNAWGLNVAIGHWVGGKDAGSGATLEITDALSSHDRSASLADEILGGL